MRACRYIPKLVCSTPVVFFVLFYPACVCIFPCMALHAIQDFIATCLGITLCGYLHSAWTLLRRNFQIPHFLKLWLPPCMVTISFLENLQTFWGGKEIIMGWIILLNSYHCGMCNTCTCYSKHASYPCTPIHWSVVWVGACGVGVWVSG